MVLPDKILFYARCLITTVNTHRNFQSLFLRKMRYSIRNKIKVVFEAYINRGADFWQLKYAF